MAYGTQPTAKVEIFDIHEPTCFYYTTAWLYVQMGCDERNIGQV